MYFQHGLQLPYICLTNMHIFVLLCHIAVISHPCVVCVCVCVRACTALVHGLWGHSLFLFVHFTCRGAGAVVEKLWPTKLSSTLQANAAGNRPGPRRGQLVDPFSSSFIILFILVLRHSCVFGVVRAQKPYPIRIMSFCCVCHSLCLAYLESFISSSSPQSSPTSSSQKRL